MTNPLDHTEPLEVLQSKSGHAVAVPKSIADALRWSMAKLAVQQERGCSFDEAEAIVRAELAAEEPPDTGV